MIFFRSDAEKLLKKCSVACPQAKNSAEDSGHYKFFDRETECGTIRPVMSRPFSTASGILLLVGWCVLFGSASAEGSDMESAVLWGLIPGAGHYYLGEPEAGTAYVSAMLPLIGSGVWLYERNDELERDEVNTFWLLALKEWELSLFTTYRSALSSGHGSVMDMGVDDTSVGDLFLAPFRREQCSDVMVVLAALLGVAGAVYDSRDSDGCIGDVSRIGIFGAEANREWGSALYGVDALSVSLAAGVSEEAVWRGLVQNEMEQAFGKGWGLCSGAAMFGAAHVVDLDGSVSGERVAVATVAGLYLGYMYQRERHRLSKPIAAHFWYNFMAMMTGFALDPENNPLGVEVSFRF